MFGVPQDAEGVPVTCRQMYANIVEAYRLLEKSTVIGSRDELVTFLQRRGFLSSVQDARLDMKTSTHRDVTRSGLLDFCSLLSTGWLQPYFAAGRGLYWRACGRAPAPPARGTHP